MKQEIKFKLSFSKPFEKRRGEERRGGRERNSKFSGFWEIAVGIVPVKLLFCSSLKEQNKLLQF